jgi:predicted lactoylglutathione lyase
VLATLGVQQTNSSEWGDFSLAAASTDNPATRRLHVGFAAPTREHVDAFWSAGIEAGARDDGAPGPRPQYADGYYGGFLLDPDGNSAEAVAIGDGRGDTSIDHIWVRVSDVAAAKRFYELIAPLAGLWLDADTPERVKFDGFDGSLSLVAGDPTENVHLAFPAADDARVDEFHRLATAAGYRDNGAPGERPIYHPGYYGAFVLDPDGNNVELVNHNR